MMLQGLRQPWLAVTLAGYLVLYGALLVFTDGLPYVIDNNESFSSLWHAASLFHFGVGQTYGLADEVFSPHADAHPYVHTHQGNFPRLFAFLIYVLGARSVESQTVVTTFTVGLAAVLLAYAFFARLATAAFAALVCIIFMTDYVLFAQWHVATYRVWYCFLLFLCLYSTHRATEEGTGRWLATTAAAFACLFYFELVFAAFVAVFCALYTLLRSVRAPGRWLRVGGAQALGATVALAVLIAQGIGYMGWEDFRRDIYLTFAARNDFARDPSLLQEVAKFYESRKVIFWHNFLDRSRFEGVIPFVRSFTSFDWRVHTPLLAVSAWVLIAGWLCGLWRTRSGSASRRMVAGFAFIAMVFCAFALTLPLHETLFDHAYRPVWQEVLRVLGSQAIPMLAILAATLVAAYVAANGAEDVFGADRRAQLRGVLLFLICGTLAYTLVYSLSPGYIYSGYLYRNAPFTVFLTDVVVAVAFYVAVRATQRLVAIALADGPVVAHFKDYAACSVAGIGVLLTAFLPVYWITVQAKYVNWLPPTHYAFLKKLADPPYRGASFVVNNYPAPVAAFTGQWATQDSAIAQAFTMQKGANLHVGGDRRYLWFADRDTNVRYRKPDYFLCMLPQGPPTIINRILRERGYGPGEPGCSQLPLVRMAKSEKASIKGLRLLDYDRAGLDAIGFDSWAIVKLEWDDAPGGTVLDWSLKPVTITREAR